MEILREKLKGTLWDFKDLGGQEGRVNVCMSSINREIGKERESECFGGCEGIGLFWGLFMGKRDWRCWIIDIWVNE